MIVQLDKKDKIELLKAIRKGELDVFRVSALYMQLEGANMFLEIMKRVDADDGFEFNPED